MTVIAIKDGVIAADTAVWSGDLIIGHVQKIVRLKDGRFIACAGSSADGMACIAWLNQEADKPEPTAEDQFGAVILGPSGVERVDSKFRVYKAAGQCIAEGSHIEFMLGAMMSGLSAEQAVYLAIAYGSWAAGKVQVERLLTSSLP